MHILLLSHGITIGYKTTMELRHFKYFRAVAEERSFSHAAKRLFISQPAVSRAIREIEETLGTKLFRRSPEGISLTFAGEQFLSYARKIVELAEESIKIISPVNRENNTVHMGFIPASLVSFVNQMLKRIRRSLPNITIKIHEMSPGDQIVQLRKGNLDIALVGTPCGIVRDEFETMKLRELPQQVILNANHRLANHTSISLAALKDERFVGFNEDKFPGRNQLIQRACKLAGFNPNFGLQVESLLVLLGIVGSEEGISIVPSEVSSLPHPGVVFLSIQEQVEPEILSAIWRRDDSMAALNCVITAMQQMVSEG